MADLAPAPAPAPDMVCGVVIDPKEHYAITLSRYIADYAGHGEMTRMHPYNVTGQTVLDLRDNVATVVLDPPEHPVELIVEKPQDYVPRKGKTPEQAAASAASAATFQMRSFSPAPALTPVAGVRLKSFQR